MLQSLMISHRLSPLIVGSGKFLPTAHLRTLQSAIECCRISCVAQCGGIERSVCIVFLFYFPFPPSFAEATPGAYKKNPATYQKNPRLLPTPPPLPKNPPCDAKTPASPPPICTNKPPINPTCDTKPPPFFTKKTPTQSSAQNPRKTLQKKPYLLPKIPLFVTKKKLPKPPIC